MSSHGTPAEGGLPLSNGNPIDAECDRLEAAWRSGERPDLPAFLASSPGPARARRFSERR
jgi:hypothetical protein